MRHRFAIAALIGIGLLSQAKGAAQTLPVQAVAGPGEEVGAAYLHLWKDCRDDLRRRADEEDTALACQKLAIEADRFAPDAHFVTRRSAYVSYATALTQAGAYGDATKAGDKAVAIVQQQHDDSSGTSAAYFARGHARGLAGDLSGAIADLQVAEANERKVLAVATDVFLRVESTTALKRELEFHSQILEAMHQSDAAQAKSEEADRL